MKILGQTITVATTLGFALLVAPACVDNDQSIYIRAALLPSTTRTNGVCVYTADVTQPIILGDAYVDAYVRGDYQATLLVGNQMVQRGDNTQPRSESTRAHIQGAVVRVTDANGGAINSFTSPSQGFIDPATGTSPSYAPIGVAGIDGATMLKIASNIPFGPEHSKLVIANIKVFGETIGGVDLESAEFQLPIRVCRGCSISFAGNDDPATPGIDCNSQAATAAGGGSTSSTTPILPCNEGQDEPEPCTLCIGRRKTSGGVDACQTEVPDGTLP